MMNHRHANEADYRNLLSKIGDEARVLFGSAVGADYGRDELSAKSVIPEIVVKAMSAEDVSAVLSYASAEKIAVTPDGTVIKANFKKPNNEAQGFMKAELK